MAQPLLQSVLDFKKEYPDCDLTDREQYYGLLIEKRAQFPDDMDDAAAEKYNTWLLHIEKLQHALVSARATYVGIPHSGLTQQGNAYILTSFNGTTPCHVHSTNVAAAETTAVDLVRLNPNYLNASGSGLYVNLNDTSTLLEHTEFQLPNNGGSRIMLKETGFSGVNHSTHCMGIIAAWGYDPQLIGMAPRAWLRGHSGLNTSDITAFGARWPGQPLDGSTTNPRDGSLQLRSVTGSAPLGSASSGLYTTASATFDQALRDTPYYVHHHSSGNTGNTTTGNYYTLNEDQPVAKNVITVGSITDMIRDGNGNFDYTPASGGVLSDFSSRGPTFDGRIKPDFTCNGHLVRSASGTNSSELMSGTSQAVANAGGTTTLLIDYITKSFPGHFFRSSTIKAILVNTATGLGTAGPDYHYGWGAMNAKAACDLVKGYADNPATRTIIEDELRPSQTWTRTYRNASTGAVRMTLAWLDPSGTSQTSTSTDRSPRLVNNLNLRLIAGNGTIYQPWVMPYTTGNGTLAAFDPALYGAAAVTGNNIRDNLEQVFVANLPAGDYTVQVTHEGSLKNDTPQLFSLAFSRLTATSAPAPAISSVAFPNATAASNALPITVEGSGFVLGANMFIRRITSTGTTQSVQGYGVIPAGNRITARFDAANLSPGYWDIVVVNPGGVESILPNGYLFYLPGGTPRRMDIYTNNFENGDSGIQFFTNFPGWSVAVPNKSSFFGPATGYLSQRALTTFPSALYPALAESEVILNNINTVGFTNIRVEYQQWFGVAGGDFTYVRFKNNGSIISNILENPVIETNWRTRTFDLPAAAEGITNLEIEFDLYADRNIQSFGCAIDDVKVTGMSSYALPPLVSTPTIPNAGQHTSYSTVISATDADTAGSSLTYTAFGLPAGLSMASNGTISGTPTTVGTTNFTISVSDGIYTSHSNRSITIVSAIAKWRTDNGFPADGSGLGANNVDGDNDDLVNLLEYAFGSNPQTFTSPLAYTANGSVVTAGKPVAINLNASGVDYRAVFLRRKNHAAAGLTYTVQFSADLASWVDSTVIPTVLTSQSGANLADVEAVAVPFPSSIPVDDGFKKPTFFRISVSGQ